MAFIGNGALSIRRSRNRLAVARLAAMATAHLELRATAVNCLTVRLIGNQIERVSIYTGSVPSRRGEPR